MVAAITERRKNEERRAHLLAECLQAPIIKVQSELLFDLKESNQRVAVALETLAARGAQVDSHEKHLDTHDAHIDTAFNQIRGIDARVMNLEIKKGEWEGSKKAKEEIGAKAEKDKTYIWTVLEKIQLSIPIILGIFFLFWLFSGCLISIISFYG